VTRSSRCALSITLAFLDDPATAPNTDCLQSPDVMHFAP
jgi:hypothetical protein